MSKTQLRNAYENKEEFIEGEWEEEYPDEHDWRETLPYGYSSDGVRVRSCKDCGMSLVFNLDSLKRPYIESFGNSDYECNFKYEGDEDEDYDAEEFDSEFTQKDISSLSKFVNLPPQNITGETAEKKYRKYQQKLKGMIPAHKSVESMRRKVVQDAPTIFKVVQFAIIGGFAGLIGYKAFKDNKESGE